MLDKIVSSIEYLIRQNNTFSLDAVTNVYVVYRK